MFMDILEQSINYIVILPEPIKTTDSVVFSVVYSVIFKCLIGIGGKGQFWFERKTLEQEVKILVVTCSVLENDSKEVSTTLISPGNQSDLT